MELRLDRESFVVERLRERGHESVGADHDRQRFLAFELARLGARGGIDVPHFDGVAEVALDDRHLGVEVAGCRLLVRLQLHRAGEDAAVSHRLFQLDGFLLAELGGDFEFDAVTFVAGVLIGVSDHQIQLLADVQLRDRPVVIAIDDREDSVADEPRLSRHTRNFRLRRRYGLSRSSRGSGFRCPCLRGSRCRLRIVLRHRRFRGRRCRRRFRRRCDCSAGDG